MYSFIRSFFICVIMMFAETSTALAAIESLKKIRLSPVLRGAIAGEPIEAGSLWSHEPVMIHVVRRPG
jgi:hypothetical protein